MTSSRSFRRWTMIAALFVLIGQFLATGAPARAAVGSEALLQPTPLVLKDGRIANVSIHVLPFGNGQGELAGDIAARLAELTATVATDCFLTAQVIGHVSSREVADNETLAAHRLARSRADAVQASLIGGGLPAKAIASVWDWQFLVREPRATLWVFRLVQGEDCEGEPLDGSAPAVVAESDAGQTAPAQAAPPREARPQHAQAPRGAEDARVAEAQPRAEAPRAEGDGASGPDLAGVVGSAVAAEAAPQAEGRNPGQAPAARASRPPLAAAASSGDAEERAKQPASAGPASDAASTLIRPLPALSPASPAEGRAAAGDDRPAGEREIAAVEPKPATAGAGSQRTAGNAALGAATSATQQGAAQQAAAQQDPERQGKVEWGEDNVVITFATNSSYFPPGTARRLASLLGDLAEDKRYRVRLEVGVSGSDTVVGASTAEEARRYNRWLAERRMGRVREWLDEHAGDRQLEVEPTFQADDNSRRVVVRVAPIS